MVLPLIQFIPELNLNLDPESGILGAGGGDLIILSMDEINGEIAKVEAAADELMNKDKTVMYKRLQLDRRQ